MRNDHRSLAGALALVVSVLVTSLHAQQEPADAAIRKAIVDVVARLARKPEVPLTVRQILGCYPGAGDNKGQFLCLVDMNGPDGEFRVQTLPLERMGADAWQVMPPTVVPTPACPSKAVAEPLFQKKMGSAARVTDAPNENDGTFTDERGKFRDKKGPMRLMCTYEITRSMGAATVVAYFTFKDGKYGLDGDVETWY